MYLSFRNFFGIAVKSLLITLCIALCFGLVIINCNFAEYICKITSIPNNLALTVMSPGFYNEVVIITSVFEIGFLVYICNKLLKYPKINELYERIYYL